MIEDELSAEKGRIAAQFLMSQRYIGALQSQAKSTNTLLVNQDIGFVPNGVDDSFNLIRLEEKKRRRSSTSSGLTSDGAATEMRDSSA
jgi:hypothetical protein